MNCALHHSFKFVEIERLPSQLKVTLLSQAYSSASGSTLPPAKNVDLPSKAVNISLPPPSPVKASHAPPEHDARGVLQPLHSSHSQLPSQLKISNVSQSSQPQLSGSYEPANPSGQAPHVNNRLRVGTSTSRFLKCFRPRFVPAAKRRLSIA